MKGHKIGYVRVSSVDQNIGRQLEGVEVDRVFIDKASGKNTARPKFQEMLSYVREGDMIVVHSMDRFARSLKDLVTEVDQLVKRGVAIHCCPTNFIRRTSIGVLLVYSTSYQEKIVPLKASFQINSPE